MMALYRRPEGRRLKRQLAGCEGSAVIFTAFLRDLELWRSLMEGRGQPMMRSAARTTLWSLALERAESYQTECEDVSTLNDGPVELHHDGGADLKSSQRLSSQVE